MSATLHPARDILNAELSLLAFQRRVLALAEDSSTPLLERLRFLGIVTSNIDELYMVRMVELRRAAIDEPDRVGEHGLTSVQRLVAVEHEIESILGALAQCATQCLRDVHASGVQLLSWQRLESDERAALTQRYLEDIQPDLLPHAITVSPGHPLPHLPHLGLFIAVVFRAADGARTQLAEHELPTNVPRFFAVPGRERAVIPIEEVLRANAFRLHPDAVVEGAHLFRVTRGGDLPLSDYDGGDMLGAVALATERRPHNPAVRVEVERTMPARAGELIVDSLRREAIGRDMELTVTTVQIVDGLLDLRCLQSLPLPPAGAAEYAPQLQRAPLDSPHGIFAAIRAGDLLMHHPFDSFDATVVRFFQDAASDPTVSAISATLYRVGDPSPIVDALIAAAEAGKQIFVLVELQARFDEIVNVRWARAIERAGGRVVYGMSGLKVHAKVALVTRLEQSVLVRYAHVGTGNYNPRSGRQYTDLSLFSAREELTADIASLFDAFDSASVPPDALAGSVLLAPNQLLRSLLKRIHREADHARAGRVAGITIKINALADTEIVRALYDASQAGVRIALIVRGICTLRAGVVGLSENISVVSIVGRLLEHSRIYRFENDGSREYFIGSSDLRPRNLRRRVELLVPIPGAAHRARLDRILQNYLDDRSAWELTASGSYVQRHRDGVRAQDLLD